MPSFNIRVSNIKPLSVPNLSKQSMVQLGAYIIKDMKERVQLKHQNIYDQSMPAYSPNPIYVPLSGPGQALGGRSGFTRSTLRKVAKRLPGGVGGKGQTQHKSGIYISRTGKSVHFPNRSAYKQSIGASGMRDLTDTGAMLGALTVVAQTATQLVIGFTSQLQQDKAAGNQKISPWFGVSPAGAKRARDFAQKLLERDFKKGQP